MERKLTAILSADVQGYSRLMGEAEEATLRTLTSHRQLIDSQIAHHRGRIVGTAGDSVLAEFASVVAAVQCAVVIQQTLKAENAQLPAARQMEFRIGINLGDVMVEGDQIYGDGVNIAARLEALAEAGGICLSGIVHEQVKHKLALHYEDLGEQAVKNIAEPVRVWRTVMDDAATALVEQVVLRQAPHEREQAAVTLSPKNRRLGEAYRSTGRYEEAIAAFKRALTRNPDLLPAHLNLAAIYSELGREEEARAEAAEVLKISPKYSLEVWRQRAPYKDPAVLERMLAALRKVGLK
jgi:class 3 adenylate cyclase